jgi:Right handed beta helix region
MRTFFRTSDRAATAMSLAVTVALGGIAPAAAVAGPRMWHVAPGPLAGLPADDQVRTISEAAAKAGPGDTVVIHGGVYREAVTVENSGTEERPIRFRAADGENVVVTGADAIREWVKEPGGGNVFSAPWPHRFIGWNRSGTHPDDDEHKMIGRCEQVFILGYPLLQVLDRGGLRRGTFYVDLDARRIHVCPRDGADLAKEGAPLVEASARQLLWHVKGEHVHLRGLRFRYAANMAQHGAAQFEGDHGAIEDCSFESTNAGGATFAARGLVVRRCVFRDNGQVGFGAARAHDLHFSDCVVRDNNVKGFSRGWEAGGNKLVLCRNAVIERSQFLNNRGNGLWFDIGNEKCVVHHCLIADNDDAGIFYEISYGLHAHDNVIVGNGFRETPGSWGAGAGISLSSSPDCVIERNLIIGNREGFDFREQDRKTPRIDDEKERWIWNHDERITHNVLALNRDAQVWGWFDVDDGRQWPAALQVAAEKEKGRAARDLAAPYQARDRVGAPTGLTLEKLAITFEDNLYDARPWQGLFHWGVAWKRNKRFATLDEVRAELKLESGGRAAEFRVENLQSRDFRVPAGSPALVMGCYPKGEIPGVQLGAMPAR